MLIHVRTIAVSTAVICFFGLSLISWISGLSPFTCCKRALVGAVVAYIVAGSAVKVINAVLTNAIITNWVNQQKDNAGDGRN